MAKLCHQHTTMVMDVSSSCINTQVRELEEQNINAIKGIESAELDRLQRCVKELEDQLADKNKVFKLRGVL